MDQRKNRENQVMFPYLVLLICFISQALSMGFFVSFGTVYVELIKIFDTTETQAAWVGSIAISMCFFFGFISSLLSKRYGCGNMISIGGALVGAGLLLSSIAPDILTLTITFGGVTSIGCSFLYFSSLSVLPNYFKKSLCLATSIACCGVSLSGVTFSPMMAYLIKEYNFQTCFQLFSITALLPMVGGLIIQKHNTEENPKDGEIFEKLKVFDKSIFSNKRLMLVILAMSIVELCYYTPYVHLVNFAMHNGVSLLNASFLPVILSIGSLVGKIIFGLIGQIKYFNIIYLFQIFLLLMAVCLTLLPLATTYMHLILFSTFYGIFDGAFTGYILPVVAKMVAPQQLGVALGIMYTFLSIELLLGPPLAGLIYTRTSSYQIPFMLFGGIIVIAALLLFCIPYIKEDKSIKQFDKISLISSYVEEYGASPTKSQDINNKDECTIMKCFFVPKLKCGNGGKLKRNISNLSFLSDDYYFGNNNKKINKNIKNIDNNANGKSMQTITTTLLDLSKIGEEKEQESIPINKDFDRNSTVLINNDNNNNNKDSIITVAEISSKFLQANCVSSRKIDENGNLINNNKKNLLLQVFEVNRRHCEIGQCTNKVTNSNTNSTYSSNNNNNNNITNDNNSSIKSKLTDTYKEVSRKRSSVIEFDVNNKDPFSSSTKGFYTRIFSRKNDEICNHKNATLNKQIAPSINNSCEDSSFIIKPFKYIHNILDKYSKFMRKTHGQNVNDSLSLLQVRSIC